jgi:hypothetical protein
MGVSGIVRVTELRMRWVGHVERMEGRQMYIGLWWENLKESAYLDKPMRRGEDNIKMELKEISQKGLNWIYLAQNRDLWRAIVNTVMTFWVR